MSDNEINPVEQARGFLEGISALPDAAPSTVIVVIRHKVFGVGAFIAARTVEDKDMAVVLGTLELAKLRAATTPHTPIEAFEQQQGDPNTQEPVGDPNVPELPAEQF